MPVRRLNWRVPRRWQAIRPRRPVATPRGFIFQCGSGSAEEGEEEKAPDEAACFSGNDGKASGEV